MNYKIITKILLTIILAIVLSGCGQIASDSNFTLVEGEAVAGNLIVLSQNVILTEGSSVDGSVIMLCCNLKLNKDM